MTIRRFDPFQELSSLQNRVNQVFGAAYARDDQFAATTAWVPPVDIYETAGHDLVIKAELPDVPREDISVTVEQNTLMIKGAKKTPADVAEDQFKRVERRFGAFSRSFTLPSTVDAAKVSADYRNGVLTVTLPYREEAKPRSIAVDIAA
jgi:HSP20 family protein